MRSMIFREAGMTNGPIAAVLFPGNGRTACWTPFREHPDDLQHRKSGRRIATTFSIADLNEARSPTVLRASPKVIFLGELNRSTLDSSHWGPSP
jgi:hypothetical protein